MPEITTENSWVIRRERDEDGPQTLDMFWNEEHECWTDLENATRYKATYCQDEEPISEGEWVTYEEAAQ